MYFWLAKFHFLKLLFSLILLSAFFIRPTAKIAVISYYGFNIESIVTKYCVNKATPELKCNGKCYLKKKLEFSNTSAVHTKVKNINVAEAFTPVFLHYPDHYLSVILQKTEKLMIPTSNQNLFEKLVFFEIEYPPEYS